MGYGPAEIDQMSIWQFMSAHDGWLAANSSDGGSPDLIEIPFELRTD